MTYTDHLAQGYADFDAGKYPTGSAFQRDKCAHAYARIAAGEVEYRRWLAERWG
jgi:hypothetical protein